MTTKAKKFMSSKFVASMLSSHSAIGLAAGALLYILCLSGTAIVFHEEFERWEQPNVHEFTEYSPELVEKAALNTLAEYGEPQHHFNMGLPIKGMPRMIVGTDDGNWFIDENGNRAEKVHHPWSEFLHDLHFYFHLPTTAGLIATGILGAMMVGLILSGILSHPKIFKDAFSFRLNRSYRLSQTDLHNRLSVWAAPFHLTISLTGALLGLASVLAFFMAGTYFGGDTAKVFEPIFGTEIEGSKAPAPLADISNALDNLKTINPDLEPWYLIFHDAATEGQTAELLAKHPSRLPYGETYYFNEDGDITQQLGLTNGPAGQQIVASVYQLHFGSYGGIIIKIFYALMGLALCFVSVTGINIWLTKRREKGRAAPRLEQTWAATVWAAPAGLAATLFLETAGFITGGLTTAVFWGIILLAITTAIATKNKERTAYILRISIPFTLLATVITHLIKNPETAFSEAAYGVNGGLLCIVLFFVWRAVKNARQQQVFNEKQPA